MKSNVKIVTLAVAWALVSGALQAADTEVASFNLSQANRGGVGLIQTPTARMGSEGAFAVNYADNDQYRFWSASVQLFPWLETTVRYTDVRTRLFSQFPGFSGDQSLKDKGIDVKLRLWQESYWLPEVSLGFLDFGGTGFFESEFIAASKRFGPVDVHLGMGFGSLGRSGNIANPFCEAADRFCRRSSAFRGQGGMIDYQNFFTGPAALFGGIEYQTPWQPLSIKLEYEGNDYSRERAGTIVQDSAFNFGLVYRHAPFDLQLSYQRGNTLAFSASYKLDFQTLSQVKFDPPPQQVKARGLPRKEFTRTKMRNDLYFNAGFVTTRVQLTDDELIIQGEQVAFRDDDVSIERISRVLANVAPHNVKRYRIIVEQAAMPMVETVVDAAEFRAQARYDRLEYDLKSTYVRQNPQLDEVNWQFVNQNRGLSFSLETFWIQMLGNPEAFFMYQGGLLPGASYSFNDNWLVGGALKATVLENFDKFNFKVDSQDSTLPRVRTFSREYATRSRVTLDKLFATGRDNLTENVFGQVYGGYLEAMFAGVGAEVLYRPIDSRFAVGFDLNYVRQRDFASEYKLFDYSVLTGFATLYWQPSFLNNSLVSVSAGRFLAKDVGVNIDVGKRFNSGIVVGAFAAITDATSAEYGEGSFTKGFYLSIPFDLMSFKSTRGQGAIPWVPIARDGGQMLQRPVKLYGLTQERQSVNFR
ncbi:membrane protein [Alishewanella longhuensis]|uniref:Membrane protein n=1 Tax=Alishewanella longhuensis TaxID=1091037 RepID=A0ABQ3L6A9_9ALTE|nr:YjbH domain-containing protein [Alishewanella longhuensis]GHG67980.1 membrane protein [Alishewanella longhuensis]